MNWEALGYWILIAILVGIVAYLTLGRPGARATAWDENGPWWTQVIDAKIIRVVCSDCGETYALGSDVVTLDGKHHVSYPGIIAAMLEHRAEAHGAAA